MGRIRAAAIGLPPPSLPDRIFLAGAPPELVAIEQAYLLFAERRNTTSGNAPAARYAT